jgi:hypothetical protein
MERSQNRFKQFRLLELDDDVTKIYENCVSRTEFCGTQGFHRTSLGVPREIVEKIYTVIIWEYRKQLQIVIPRNIVRSSVRQLAILE